MVFCTELTSPRMINNKTFNWWYNVYHLLSVNCVPGLKLCILYSLAMKTTLPVNIIGDIYERQAKRGKTIFLGLQKKDWEGLDWEGTQVCLIPETQNESSTPWVIAYPKLFRVNGPLIIIQHHQFIWISIHFNTFGNIQVPFLFSIILEYSSAKLL